MTILDQITGPRDLDRLSQAEFLQLAGEIRAFLIREVSRTGGHLGPNLTLPNWYTANLGSTRRQTRPTALLLAPLAYCFATDQ